MQKMGTCLWFDGQAEEAAKLYISIFKNGKIGNITKYGKAGVENHQQPEGTVMSVEFELNGQSFMGLNGGPLFKFNESVSFMIPCETQKEIDHYWEAFTKEGQESQCGWLKDKFGVSWQITPTVLQKMLTSGDKQKTERVTAAFMKMKKMDIATLERAYEGK